MAENAKQLIQALLNEEAAKASLILRMVISEMGITKRSLQDEWGITPPTCNKYLNDIMMLDHYDLVFLANKLQIDIGAMHKLQVGGYESADQFITENNIEIPKTY